MTSGTSVFLFLQKRRWGCSFDLEQITLQEQVNLLASVETCVNHNMIVLHSLFT